MIQTDEEGFVLEIPSIEDPPETERESVTEILGHALAKIEEASFLAAHGTEKARGAVLQAIDLLLEVDALTVSTKSDLTPAGLLTETARVLQDRERQYGSAGPHFARAAAMWSALLRCDVRAHHVPLCMMAIKALRVAETPELADSWIDLAGYAALGTQAAEVKAP